MRGFKQFGGFLASFACTRNDFWRFWGKFGENPPQAASRPPKQSAQAILFSAKIKKCLDKTATAEYNIVIT
jgi:hypothetical protein